MPVAPDITEKGQGRAEQSRLAAANRWASRRVEAHRGGAGTRYELRTLAEQPGRPASKPQGTTVRQSTH